MPTASSTRCGRPQRPLPAARAPTARKRRERLAENGDRSLVGGADDQDRVVGAGLGELAQAGGNPLVVAFQWRDTSGTARPPEEGSTTSTLALCEIADAPNA